MMDFFDIKEVPSKPGVYIFKKDEQIIYIGKAKNLRNRLKNYVGSRDSKTREIVENSNKLEYITTKSVVEAELLESKLIFEKKPYYNIQYKYRNPIKYISVINKDGYPYFSISSKFSQDTVEIFHPFISGVNFRELLKILGNLFGIRQCEYDFRRTRPKLCIYYHLGFCSGPCQGLISQENYNQSFQNAINFIKSQENSIKFLIDHYTQKIEQLSNELKFEEAMAYRDKLVSLQNFLSKFYKSMEEVYIYLVFEKDIKFIGFYFPLYGVKIVELENINKDFSPTQIIFDTIIKNLHFSKKIFVQKEYYQDLKIFIKNYLNFNDDEISQKIRNIEILTDENENFLYIKNICNEKLNYLRINDIDFILKKLSKLLFIEKIDRIEVLDVSHFAGENVYGVIVVFENKKFNKSQYRVYKLKSKFNDFENIYEMVYRRFLNYQIFSSFPQLIVIDGGRGQLKYALKAYEDISNLKELTDIKFISIAKPQNDNQQEKVYLYNNTRIRKIEVDSYILRFLISLRDEAHRFANSKRIKYSGILK